MLGHKEEKLLTALSGLCLNNGYTVLTLGDIKTASDMQELTLQEAELALSNLNALGYINLRFYEGDEFCLSVLQKGREFVPTKIEKHTFFVRYKGYIITAISAFFGALIGALIGGI